ncbi:hypothetical protein FKG94_22070 [Exilibacterium tricleocarpae]|uniref:ATPase n=1 Tax=Exilibacterium tricleocarpae TaxID=2591008 RepID=A0A545SZ09_9GAMM|nr:hypothetical protein [Exilibacterium tricleocarpae]TQV70204.1 hypothetical protein FKG94_22070 [Exilibacterium tricleocarpae]
MVDTEHEAQPASLHSRGVEQLLERLREKGVAAGRAEAQRIVDEAQRRADWMLEQAQEEARSVLEEAEKEAAFAREAGREALALAARDTLLKLKEQLVTQFSESFRRSVNNTLARKELLAELVLEIAGRAPRAEKPSTVYLCAEPEAEPSADSAKLRREPLLTLLTTELQGLLREGIELKTQAGKHTGVKLTLHDKAVSVDLTDGVIAEILLSYLQPRFRALLEGVELEGVKLEERDKDSAAPAPAPETPPTPGAEPQ